MNVRRGPLSDGEMEENRELLKQLRERIRQLRMYDGDIEDFDDDEEADFFIGDGI